jgi:uncharacterized protein YidB (DUF937 family)
MALLDNVINAVASKVAGDRAPALRDFLTENGGLTGLSEKFRNGGLGQVFGSWVSTGENLKLTPEQVEAVMGNERIKAFATLVGIDHAKASEFLATTLPQLVDRLTPEGKVPEEAAVADAGAVASAPPANPAPETTA